jgi:pyruvate-ferredoxin/flavodoxin oxidoreductase
VVLGVRHPLALESAPLDLRPPGSFSLRGHSIGGFGSVTTNRLVATLAAELFDLRVQAYPRYGSEKKGLPTTYYLTLADRPLHLHEALDTVEMVAIHDVAAFRQGRPLNGLVDGGILFVESAVGDAEALWASLPSDARAEILARSINVWWLDTARLARENAPRPDLEIRMRGVALAGVFLRVAPFAARAGLGRDQLLKAMAARLDRFYGKRGADVVAANLLVITSAYDTVRNATELIAGPALAPPAPLLLEARA